MRSHPLSRIAHLETWLAQQLPGQSFSLAPASADASFRRYFRVTPDSGNGPAHIVMDAPPEQEDCAPWLRIGQMMGDAGLHVPHVLASDLTRGFVLMSDLGTTTYLDVLTGADPATAHALYADALGSLAALQVASTPGVLPPYSHEVLMREMRLFPEWYIARHLGVALTPDEAATLERSMERIAVVNLAEPQVYVHRDYHSRNLMRVEEGANPGVIDFQDALYGPLTYDLASLFKDAYIDWEEDFTLDLLVRYWDIARGLGLPVRAEFGDFLRDYDWMGVQRHLKVLGIFARLSHRDGKHGYLDSVPRLLDYLRRACLRYGELHPLLKLLDRLHPDTVTRGLTF